MSILKRVPLTDICRPKQWPTLPAKALLDEGTPVYGANGVIGFTDKITHKNPVILVGCRGSCGTVHLTPPNAYATGNAMALDNLDLLQADLRFLYYQLSSMDFHEAITGSSQPQITKTSLSKIYVVLPSLDEQKRIAEILDKADEIRRRRKQAIELTGTFLRSVFLDMFGDPISNPRRWKVLKAGKALMAIDGGWSATGEERRRTQNEWAVLKISAVTSGVFNPEEYKVLDEQGFSKNVIIPKKGDLLFSRANTRELVGATCLVPSDQHKLILPDKLWRLSVNHEIATPEFFHFALSHPSLKKQLTRTATGTSGSMLNISMKKLRDLDMPFPSIDLQKAFSSIVWKAYEEQKKLAVSKEIATSLVSALAQEAFQWKLTQVPDGLKAMVA